MSDGVLFNERVFLSGKTRSGKTVLARHLFDTFTGARRTAVDPKGRLHFPGVAPARTPEELDLAAPLSHFIPSHLEDWEYEEVFRRLWFAGGPRVIWLDEAFGPTKGGWAPKYLRMIVQQGAEAGIGLLACSQRTKNVEATLRTEAEHLIFFVPAPHRLDLDALAQEIGIGADELAAAMRQLQAEEGQHSHFWYRRNSDELVPCAPLPAGWARPGPGPGRTASQER